MARSKESNDRMASGSTPARTDPDGTTDTVTKQDRRATSDVETIAEELLALDDRATARNLARVLVRTGDSVGEIAKHGDGAPNDRMEPSR